MTEAVRVEGIHKFFKAEKSKIEALQNISFSVNPGELFGLIGPDGAGKTDARTPAAPLETHG